MTDNLPFPVASIEFDKVYMVMDKRLALGYSDRELSFLLGYRHLYVRDVENPLHTLRYTPKDTNYLLSIFDCRLPELMPAKVDEAFYQVKVVESVDQAGGSVYEIFREKGKQFIAYKVVRVGEPGVFAKNSADAENIMHYVSHLYRKGYFDDPKTALELYKKCTHRFGKPLQPQLVMDALSFYTSKRKAPRIVHFKNVSARTVYQKEG